MVFGLRPKPTELAGSVQTHQQAQRACTVAQGFGSTKPIGSVQMGLNRWVGPSDATYKLVRPTRKEYVKKFTSGQSYIISAVGGSASHKSVQTQLAQVGLDRWA